MKSFSISLRVNNADVGHVHLSVFIGVDRDHRQLTGELVLRVDEFWWFRSVFVGEEIDVANEDMVPPPSETPWAVATYRRGESPTYKDQLGYGDFDIVHTVPKHIDGCHAAGLPPGLSCGCASFTV